MTAQPRKRPAFESPVRLARPLVLDPHMRRPSSTIAGAVLVLLRVAAGLLWLVALSFDWQNLATEVDADLAGITLTSDDVALGLSVVWIVAGVALAVEAVLAVLILRGRNWPRVIVMVFAVISISSSFTAWWVQGQEIRLNTTLLTLGLDVLVLLALSSRSAAAYARRRERA
ncbi:MAG: hypothetical protein QM626_06410 [Microbacterium sp.]|uniref:hypothetical protein n=1 Tax=Microbacterium sp. TaxID=51671 RepID=UPI0039E5E7B0